MAETPTGPTNKPESADMTGGTMQSAQSAPAVAPLEAAKDILLAENNEDSLLGTSAEAVAPTPEPSEVADAVSGPWKKTSPAPEQTVPVMAKPPPKHEEHDSKKHIGKDTAQTKSGAGKRLLVLLILALLVTGGGYATYPLWRSLAEPYAALVGVNLPQVTAVEAPATTISDTGTTTTETASDAQPPSPAPSAPPRAKPEPTATPIAPTAPPPPPAATPDPSTVQELAALTDRLSALEARVTSAEAAPLVPPSLTEDFAAFEGRLDEAARRITAIADEVAIVREGLTAEGTDDGLGPLAASLSDKVQSLTDRVTALEVRPDAPTVAPERLATLETALTDMDGRLSREIDKSAEDLLRVEARMAGIEDHLNALAQALGEARADQAGKAAFLVATSQLAASAAGSGFFAADLAALRATAPAEPTVSDLMERLAAHETGVPSHAVLLDRFPATASRVVDAALVGTDDGILGQTLNRITSLVSVRKTGEAAEGGVNALLNEAETALRADDLAGAVAALDGLDGDAAKAAAGWLADARARLTVDDTIRALQNKALALVSGG